MPASLRVLAVLAMLATVLAAAPAVLAGGPVKTVINLDDPAADADEAAFWTAECGFDVGVLTQGHITVLEFPAGDRTIQEINSYHVRAAYWNVSTGATIQLRDIGPDRFYLRDGRAYVGVTGRGMTGTGVIGLVVIDLETGEIVNQSGNEVGLFQDQLCAALAG